MRNSNLEAIAPFSRSSQKVLATLVLYLNQLGALISQIYFGMKLYMFRTVPPKLYNIYHCCVYSEKLLMMDGGTVRNV